MKKFLPLLLILVLSAVSCKKVQPVNPPDGPDDPHVDPPVEVNSITLDDTYAIIYSADYKLTATVDPADAPVTWTSSDESVATVESDGWVRVHSAGTVTITATAGDKEASCELVINFCLSREETANCYIVPKSGFYYFKAAKGNSSQALEGVKSVEVLWESFGTSTAPTKGDIIPGAVYYDYNTEPNNCIGFYTPTPLKQGNAVIAAKDAGGNILWSWHIWVCDGYKPEASARGYRDYYGTIKGTMMDRNLGALSATPGDVGALGLFYQWGRKDPFPGACDIAQNKYCRATGIWPAPMEADSSMGKIDFATKNPTIFLLHSVDWYYTGGGLRDNTRWQLTKTVYDPCPPGWRVPTGGDDGIWIKATGMRFFDHTWDSTNKGLDLSDSFHCTGPDWYPAAGNMSYSSSDIYNVGNGGFYWTCTPVDGSSSSVYCLNINSSHTQVTLNGNSSSRACGYSVRCCKE